MPEEHPLAPGAVSRRLFVVAPDRDERASQLAMETFLTLWANGYAPPADVGALAPPKRRNGALRSLAVRENFLEGMPEQVAEGLTVDQMGDLLARGSDFGGSDGLSLIQDALQALIDGRTRQGSAGALLMQPFHESLLWYDARKSGSTVRWMVRKVNMRGTGVTMARILLAPPAYLDDELIVSARRAVEGIRAALQAPSPYGELAARLSEAAPEPTDERKAEDDEIEAWRGAEDEGLRPLAARVIRHCDAITAQEGVGPAVKLLQVRAILALDLAHHAISRSWEMTRTPLDQRFLLVSYTPEERRRNNVRVLSEATYSGARSKLAQAIVAQLGAVMEELAREAPPTDWADCFEPRSRLDSVASALNEFGSRANFTLEAERAYELASGGGYGRPSDAFRVLLDSIDLLVGTGQYRYLRMGPELLSAMVGAVRPILPAPVESFLAALFTEWNVVVGEVEAVGTTLSDQVEGADLRRNARFLEGVLVDAGLALALSDQTCMVGQRRAEAS